MNQDLEMPATPETSDTSVILPKRKRRAKAKRRRSTRQLSTSTPKVSIPTPMEPTSTAAPTSKQAGTHTITYRPIEEGDRLDETMAGVRFKANVPVAVADTVCVQQLLVDKFETKDGLIQSRSREVKVPLYRVLEGNPYFEIDGVRPEKVRAGIRLPTSPEEYKNYATMWIARSTDAQAMDRRWSSEESLRRRCGVDDDLRDYHILPFFYARHKDCSDMEQQVA